MVHFRVGELDGVSLEMDKWKLVLEKMEHTVTYLAGSIGCSSGHEVPEMALSWVPGLVIRKNAFVKLSKWNSEKEFEEEIRSRVVQIKSKIRAFIEDNNIEFLIPNNMFSLAMNIPASIALFEVIEEKSLPGINISHDFTWERTDYSPTCTLIQNYLEKYFPPDLASFHQIVINKLAKDALKKRKGINSNVIPNVFYFEEDDWIKDEYNSNMRRNLQIDENDIVVLQATRIVERKGIELAIDVIAEMNKKLDVIKQKALYDGRTFGSNNRVVFILPNLIEDQTYALKLKRKMNELNIEYRFCNDLFSHTRYIQGDKKVYNLWDSYVHSDIVTYPSLIEGWGNQFHEAVKARLPILIFEYPVYKSDIEPLGFETISLGSEIIGKDIQNLVYISENKIEEASHKIIQCLQEKKLREQIVKKNYKIGLEKLSLTALEGYIKPLFEEIP
jgi:glycosyltransferase involved in cell wall biosynthesis